jgi:hypothetical protein
MVPLLTPIWEKTVRDKVTRDPALKTLLANHSFVLLHSRDLYADGDYLHSTYSFIYETADENKHYNDVQLQFDKGGQNRTFGVNMVTNQRNTVADLGLVDFNIDPSPARAPDYKERGRDEHQAITGHVYLEKVEDTNGNRFFVLFKILGVDEQSRYMAFVWRRLPGGKVVRRN